MFRFRRIGLRPCISLIMTLHAEICRNGSFASLSNAKLFGVMEAHVPQREVLFEGLREEEILDLPKETVEQLILLGEPIVFRVGSAMLLGSFKVNYNRLVVELAQIEGGGEGVLVSLASLTRRYARLHALSGVEWIVHAVSCAKPNLKLRRVLEGRGFIVKQVPEVGEAYHFVDSLSEAP